ncbi:MAG TPA: hypothetical protein VFO39_10605 [Candidatus Sulfotelmatobacter sp.]|nr:hypothetical protein [Candidatus Sulfotelmatobacter sp.]
MSTFPKAMRQRAIVFPVILVVALIAEFFLLEGTLGVSLPSDRNSALSTIEVKVKGNGADHFVTLNKRFTVVERTLKRGIEDLVLRESFFTDWEPGVEGPPNATVTVEAMNGKEVRWTFREPGQRGEPVTGDVYQVTKLGCCDAPPTYTYFSLKDGAKLRSAHNRLNSDELAALDASVVN